MCQSMTSSQNHLRSFRNTYYDTKERFLREKRITLRIRRMDDRLLLSKKILHQKNSRGHHSEERDGTTLVLQLNSLAGKKSQAEHPHDVKYEIPEPPTLESTRDHGLGSRPRKTNA